MNRIALLGLMILLLISCENKIAEKIEADLSGKISLVKDSFYFKPIHPGPTVEELYHEEKKLGPVFGYRFMIDGDFDGDGKKEILIEHFYSKKFKSETNKFYDSLGYIRLIGFTILKEPASFAVCTNKQIDTLQISDTAQLLGLSFLKNEGDLDDDGNDEISYVINYGDWSNCNTCHIVSYKKGEWKEIYSFGVWDWQFPDIPQTTNQFYLFGLQCKSIEPENKMQRSQQEFALINFPGLIKKMKDGKTRIIYQEMAELDTLYVEL